MQHPDWPIKIVAAKYHAVEGAWKIVDRAMDVSGGFGMFKKSELERLFRDARAGRFHPANSALDSRGRRQAGPGRQPGRAATLGIVREVCRGTPRAPRAGPAPLATARRAPRS